MHFGCIFFQICDKFELLSVLSVWTTGLTMITGSRYTNRRRQLSAPHTGWTAIRRRTAGGLAQSPTRLSGVFDTRTTASKTDHAVWTFSTRARWRQVGYRLQAIQYIQYIYYRPTCTVLSASKWLWHWFVVYLG